MSSIPVRNPYTVSHSGFVHTAIKTVCLLLTLSITQIWALNPPEPDLNPAPDVPVTSGSCPDYQGALDLPLLKGPERTKFHHWRYRYLSRIAAPYHMVNDEIANTSDKVTVTGKFDYSLFSHKDLEYEDIHAYIYGTGMSQWDYLGKFKTDSDGKVYVPVTPRPVGEYIVRMIVEGDLSSADGFVSVVPQGQETILFDIDGTLTTRDFEQVGDYLGVSTAECWHYAQETVQAYINKGYRVIYVTGRPYWNARDTREWFTSVVHLPQWHLRTNDDGGSPVSYETETFKRNYLNYLQKEKGLKIVRAYGNASTDISAYADAGIPTKETWIIGKNAGKKGTQALYDDYRNHYFEVVEPTPDSTCRSQ